MSSEQIKSHDYSYYVENLLFNHDIEIHSQFIKDLSFEKKKTIPFLQKKTSEGKRTFRLI